MSLVQVCAQTEAAIERARSLFGSGGQAPAAAALGAVDTAAESTTATAQHTGDMSGVAIARYQSFAHQSAAQLGQAAHTDTALQAHVATAATLTQTGAQRLEAIAAQTRATAQAASTATTPAAQRTILAALHSQLAQAADVVNTAKQQASGLASEIRLLGYPLDRPGPGPPGNGQGPDNNNNAVPAAPPVQEPPPPAGPIVWCVRPEGTFGFWRCSVLYPDLSVGTYWSPGDDSGGSLP
jgi:hypothetical protein